MPFKPLVLSIALVGGLPFAAEAQSVDAPKRFPQLTLDTLPKDARPLGEEMVKISSVGLAGPYNVMLRSPVFADRMKRLLD